MFKCKQCGRGFSANVPRQCPACGAVNHRPEDLDNKTFFGLILAFAGIEMLVFAILVGIVVALAIKYL